MLHDKFERYLRRIGNAKLLHHGHHGLAHHFIRVWRCWSGAGNGSEEGFHGAHLLFVRGDVGAHGGLFAAVVHPSEFIEAVVEEVGLIDARLAPDFALIGDVWKG